MELKFDGILTKDEFLQASRLADYPIAKRAKIKIDLWVFLLVVGIAIIGISIGGIMVNPHYYLVAGISTLIGATLVTVGLQLRTAISQTWDKNEAIRARCEGIVNDEYIEIRSPVGQTQLKWSNFTGYGEIQDILVLYKDPIYSTPIPKRFFETETEWLQFKSLVAQQLPITHRINPLNTTNFISYKLSNQADCQDPN